jgi:hypothetical protein
LDRNVTRFEPLNVTPFMEMLVVVAPPDKAIPLPLLNVRSPVELPFPEMLAPLATVIAEVNEPVRCNRPAFT